MKKKLKNLTILAVIGFVIECIWYFSSVSDFFIDRERIFAMTFITYSESYYNIDYILSYSLPTIIAGILGVVPGILMILPRFIYLLFTSGRYTDSLQDSLISSVIAYVLPICLMGLVLPLVMEKVKNAKVKKFVPAIFCLLAIIVVWLVSIVFWKIVSYEDLSLSYAPQILVAVGVLLLYYTFFEYDSDPYKINEKIMEKIKEKKMENATENMETAGTEATATENMVAAGTETSATESKQDNVSSKSRLALTLLAFFLGQISIHRFYAGKIGTAVFQLLLGLAGWGMSFMGVGFILLVPLEIWILIDFIMALCGLFKDGNGRRISKW